MLNNTPENNHNVLPLCWIIPLKTTIETKIAHGPRPASYTVQEQHFLHLGQQVLNSHSASETTILSPALASRVLLPEPITALEIPGSMSLPAWLSKVYLTPLHWLWLSAQETLNTLKVIRYILKHLESYSCIIRWTKCTRGSFSKNVSDIPYITSNAFLAF
jgi:hypothetical protein